MIVPHIFSCNCSPNALRQIATLHENNGTNREKLVNHSAEEVAEYHDNIFLQAISSYFSDLPEDERENRIETHSSISFPASDYLVGFRNSCFYSEDKEIRTLDQYFEVRLQMYYLGTASPDEWCDYTECLDSLDSLNQHQRLKRVSLIQGKIGQIRILWEKTMNMIFYLEFGELLEGKVSSGKSKQGTFYDSITENDHWKFILEYRELFKHFDDMYRTPEAHKGSVLKKEIIGQREFNTQVITSPIQVVSNSIMPTLRNYFKNSVQSPQMVKVRAFDEEFHSKKGGPAPDYEGQIVVSSTMPAQTFTFGKPSN